MDDFPSGKDLYMQVGRRSGMLGMVGYSSDPFAYRSTVFGSRFLTLGNCR